ncbi:PPE domain-containing protein [Nocardia sp. NBC_01388]|uniref:PPE domain-containing protein n=1 Tax=Nocardia sp. NBC_01388 TaxID=2903596 RepID=UPI0032546112
MLSPDIGDFSPLALSTKLFAGPGPVPMMAAAVAYAAAASALNAAAGGSDGAMGAMAPAWLGSSADRAQQAFRDHANWLREQALVAERASIAAATVAEANAAAMAIMPKPHDILANLARGAALSGAAIASSGIPALSLGIHAALAVNEAEYAEMQAMALLSMNTYAGQAAAALGSLPPPLPAPAIVSGGATSVAGTGASGFGGGSASGGGASGGGSGPGGPSGLGSGGSGPGGGVGHTGSGPGQSGSSPGQSGSGPGQPGPDPGGPGAGGGQSTSGPGQDAGGTGQPDLSAPQPMSLPDNASAGADGGSGDGLSAQDQGFYGTSQSSPTLAGLNGGLGSTVALGMFRGGLGDMPGASTGFRMPSNWGAATRAFGAGVGEPAVSPVARTAARGASAPTAQMRKRRDKDERSAKVFVPGQSQDVPEIEQPPVIGVIEYSDDERDEESASEAVLAGILERRADDSDSDFELTATQRQR